MNSFVRVKLMKLISYTAITIAVAIGPLCYAAGNSGDMNVLPGFKVEEVHSVDKSQGSWVSMTFGDKGELYVSAQFGQLYRLSFDNGKIKNIEALKSPGMAQGLCWAYGSLYMSVAAKKGGGVYRLTDTNGDGSFDRQEHLIELPTGNEHGVHGIIKSNKNGLFLVVGNYTPLPEGAQAINHNNWKEDNLLNHLSDPRGHASHVKAPGGYVIHFKPDGTEPRVMSTGIRNSYDIALSPNGSLFAYDADMEWDAGTPWYRPTRLIHITQGGEFGWRTGTAKWPNYYADSLAPVVELGPGSPTGMLFGTQTKFPRRYREALYLLDWTFGRIYAVHLTPDGSSYKAEKEVVVSGKAMPVCDAAVGRDGAIYFTTGGRRLNSKLYRLSYTRALDGGKVDMKVPPLTPILDRLLNKPDSGFVWKYLDNEDRRIRYTARVALEVMGAAQWINTYRQEKSPAKLIEASIALARLSGEHELQLEKMSGIEFNQLGEVQKLAYLRALSLCLIRNQEAVNSRHINRLRKTLEEQFPASSFNLNVELARVLTKLKSESSTQHILHLMETSVNEAHDIDPNLLRGNKKYGKVLEKMLANQPNAKALRFALILMSAEQGWDSTTVKRYYTWLNEAEVKDGGASYKGFIKNIRKEALKKLPEDLRQVASQLPKPQKKAEPMVVAQGPGRMWTLKEAMEATADLSKASFENGKRMYQATLCNRCHIHGSKGGVSGPNLTNLATRFSREDILKSIIEPSEVISEQYEFSTLTMKDGSSKLGRILSKTKDKIVLAQSAFDFSHTIEINTKDVVSIEASKISSMPAGMINALNPDELRDLMKFLVTE